MRVSGELPVAVWLERLCVPGRQLRLPLHFVAAGGSLAGRKTNSSSDVPLPSAFCLLPLPQIHHRGKVEALFAGRASVEEIHEACEADRSPFAREALAAMRK